MIFRRKENTVNYMAPQNAAEAVANGAQLLDEKLPGWWRQIDLETLKLSRCDLCVCGQLASTMLDVVADSPWALYGRTLDEIGVVWLETDMLYGFNIPEGISDDEEAKELFAILEAEWHDVIVARLQADALTSTEKREMLLV